jgi:cytochrome c553
VGERTCIACHQLEADHFTHTLRALDLHVTNRSDPTIPVCEACHGPGSEHAARPQIKGLIIGYTHDSGTPIETQTRPA